MIDYTVLQFRVQSTLTGVAQAVVDKTVRVHHDFAMSVSGSVSVSKRDDITLLIRNFNFALPNAKQSPINPTVRFNPHVDAQTMNTLTSVNNSIINSIDTTISHSFRSDQTDPDTDPDPDHTDANELTNNNNRRIPSYVDFSFYFKNVEIAKQNGTLPHGIDFD